MSMINFECIMVLIGISLKKKRILVMHPDIRRISKFMKFYPSD